jgi:N-acetylmuramic acid 6-phosphate etherase
VLIAGGPAALLTAAEGAEDRGDDGRTAVAAAGIGAADVLIGIAASGATGFTLACVAAAREAGALTIGLANSPDAPLLTAAEHGILLATAPEPIAGSTRLGAGTAQKVALNLFSTQLMVRLGRVYRGRMVEMRPTNAKLRRRAIGIVAALTGATEGDAETALAAADDSIKLAVLMLRGRSRPAAEAALRESGGRLRPLLDPPAG